MKALLCILTVLLSATSALGETLEASKLLQSLASQLAAIRSMPVGSYPTSFSRPSLSPLKDLLKTDIEAQLGSPDDSTNREGHREITYFFFNPKSGMRGGGGYALIIELDSDFRVTNARWQPQR